MKSMSKRQVLFLCTGNSARSQMAEALLVHKAGDKFDVYSAGTDPEEVDPNTIEALQANGLPTKGLHSKSLDTFAGKTFDYVITLCDKANNECRRYPDAGVQLAWDFPDPKSRPGNSPFTKTLNEISNRLSMFLLVEEKDDHTLSSSLAQVHDKNDTDLTLDPIVFYKSLTDSIRLKTLMLAHYHGELCVCELMEAMSEGSQPKVSRNLAVLKKANVITDRKHGQWVFYRINTDLPLWAKAVIAETTENNIELITTELSMLAEMENRPNKDTFCN